jgi:hypothetical protein
MMMRTRHSAFFRDFSAGLITGLAVLTLSGCLLADLGINGRRDKPIVGRSITSLGYARQLLLHEGRLIVSLGGDDPGIAVVDTATDLILEYFRIFDQTYQIPWSVSLHRDSLLYISNGYDRLNVLNLASGKIAGQPVSGLVAPSYYSGYYGPRRTLFASGDTVFLLDPHGGLIQGVSGNTVTFSASIGQNTGLGGIAVRDGKMFVTRFTSAHVLILNATVNGGGIRDSLDLGLLTGDTAHTLSPALAVTRGQRLFVSYQRFRRDSLRTWDSAAVAVINLSTLSLEKIIPLRFRAHVSGSDHPTVPRVADGIWYLPAYDYSDQASGVESIDLNTAAYSGTVLSGPAGGETVQDFLPAGIGKGYAVPRYSYKVKRVSY